MIQIYVLETGKSRDRVEGTFHFASAPRVGEKLAFSGIGGDFAVVSLTHLPVPVGKGGAGISILVRRIPASDEG